MEELVVQLALGVGGILVAGQLHIYESAAVVAVGGEVVRYLPCDLQPIENPSSVLWEVCDRVTSLWKVPNLPSSVRYLLEFYQRRLEFEPGDLVVLEAISLIVSLSKSND